MSGPASAAASNPAASGMDGKQAAHKTRFHCFVIDSGGDSAASMVMRDNLDMIARFQDDDPLYVLTREQSIALIRRNPRFRGKDPILVARDLGAVNREGHPEYHGFHLNLGTIKQRGQALAALREFLAFLATHRNSPALAGDNRDGPRHEGFQSAIEVIRAEAETMAMD